MGMNPTQQLVPVKPGDPMRADGQNHLVQKFLKMISVGPGLEIKRAAQGIVLLLKPQIIPAIAGGGGGGWINALSYDDLPDVSGPESEPGQVGYNQMAKITAGPQEGQIYKIRNGVWECVGETYEADTEAELENGGVIGKYALGRVGDIYYRRNDGNTGWEAQNKWA